ncbi:olfactory receptor 10A7-like [Hyperolius riggenbachi]|uniref:olfactory receptor 10A7-like n=1 Tax=Hyperolius riggenbachi TaxID=752182 RepID=UPI0035A39E58
MCEVNQTQVTQIRLLGFRGLYKFKILLFIVILFIYIMILCGNLLIITLVTSVDHLKIPMFVFLKHLATADVLLTTTLVPLMLDITYIEEGRLTLVGCLTQLYCFTLLGCVQCFIIAAMSYDRYLAICRPLHYASLMNDHSCLQLVVGSWFLGILLITSEMIVLCQLKFCSLNYVDHFFCDVGPIVDLSTSDKSEFMLQDLITSLFMIPLPFALIIITYVCISFTILKISSSYGRRKAFSTCSSHLTTVCTFYGTLITIYVVPKDTGTISTNKYTSLLYILVTPLLNPIIYSLRNQEIRRAMVKLHSNVKIAM